MNTKKFLLTNMHHFEMGLILHHGQCARTWQYLSFLVSWKALIYFMEIKTKNIDANPSYFNRVGIKRYFVWRRQTRLKISLVSDFPGNPPPISNIVMLNPNSVAISNASLACFMASVNAFGSSTSQPTWKLKNNYVIINSLLNNKYCRSIQPLLSLKVQRDMADQENSYWNAVVLY